jgi:hypothetical protein
MPLDEGSTDSAEAPESESADYGYGRCTQREIHCRNAE